MKPSFRSHTLGLADDLLETETNDKENTMKKLISLGAALIALIATMGGAALATPDHDTGTLKPHSHAPHPGPRTG